MKTKNIAEQKLLLFQKILSIENENIINRLSLFIEKITNKNQYKEIDLESINIETISFEDWNELFMEKRDLNEYIPEYDMILGEYRKKIYSRAGLIKTNNLQNIISSNFILFFIVLLLPSGLKNLLTK